MSHEHGDRRADLPRVGNLSMPRRKKATKFTLAMGRRLRAIRMQKGLTLGDVAESLKGHMSNFERGRVNITLQSLQKIAEHTGVELPYLVSLPGASSRQALIERTRFMADGEIDELLARVGPAPPSSAPPPRRKVRHRASGKGRIKV
jgi:transcriptional regulator with XRE-family HTH domain